MGERIESERKRFRVLRDAVLWTAPQHEERLSKLNGPHAEERCEAARLEARTPSAAAFFWINLAQRRDRLS